MWCLQAHCWRSSKCHSAGFCVLIGGEHRRRLMQSLYLPHVWPSCQQLCTVAAARAHLACQLGHGQACCTAAVGCEQQRQAGHSGPDLQHSEGRGSATAAAIVSERLSCVAEPFSSASASSEVGDMRQHLGNGSKSQGIRCWNKPCWHACSRFVECKPQDARTSGNSFATGKIAVS